MRPGFDEIWNRHLQNMIAYRKKHGHLLFRRKCSDKDNTLKTWISTQRKVFRKGKMPADRMEKLKAANFVWNPEDTYEKRWEEKYAELSRFYEAHGHLIIPPRKKHAALNTWIRNQRVLREGGKLSQDRIDRLDKLQFSWTEPEVNPGLVDQHCLENTASGPHLERWKASFKRLIEFNERFGHFDVNTTDDMALNQWIYQQRLRHRKGLLQKERADWLESIGFEWNVENGNQADEEWNLMFTKLKDFKEKNGHFAHRMMRAWVRTQNSTQCRDRPDRRAMLEEIGFPFQEVDAFGSSLPPTRSIPRKRTAPDSGEKCGDKEVTLKGRKPLGATKKPRRRSDCSDKIVTQEESGLYGKQCDNSSSPFAPMQSLSNKQTAQESCGKYEDEVVTRTGGKPKADRKSRKTRGDSKTNKAAKTGSSLLPFSRNCGGPNASTPESLTTKPQAPPPMKSAASPNSDNATSPNSDDAVYPLGTKLVNFFPGHGWYSGTIQAVDNHKYTVVYDDGDLEEFLIEGPTMDALVELAKSHSSLCLGDTTPVPAMTICPPASMCAAKQGSSGGRKRPQDIAKEGRTRNKKARRSETDASLEVCRTTELVAVDAGLSVVKQDHTIDVNAGESLVESDDMIGVNTGDSMANLKAKLAELDRSLKDSNKVMTDAQAELKSMESSLRRQERLCHQKDKLIDQLKARIEELENGQFVSGSVAQKVMFRLKGKF